MRIHLALVTQVAILSFSPCALASTFARATLFSENVASHVHFDAVNRRFVYTYRVSNLRGSQQGINLFGIQYTVNDIGNIHSPCEWGTDDTSHERPIFTWLASTAYQISPGRAKSGFQFSSSGAPMIAKYYSQSSMRDHLRMAFG
jgi:hypothetical protein